MDGSSLAARGAAQASAPCLAVEDLRVHFPVRRGLFNRRRGR